MSEKVKRYDISGVEKNLESGEWVRYEHYEKLLAKYNGVFEWLCSNGTQIEYFDSVDEIKADYEGGYK